MVRGSAGENIAETLSVAARSAGFKTGIVANSVEPLNKGHIGTKVIIIIAMSQRSFPHLGLGGQWTNLVH